MQKGSERRTKLGDGEVWQAYSPGCVEMEFSKVPKESSEGSFS
jgi:hypothetical protein